MVNERAQCTTVTVSASAVTGIEGFASGVALHTGSSPMVNRFAKTRIAGASHENEGALSTAACDGSDSRVGTQGVIISLGERLRSLPEHRGADESSDAWKREKDLGVAMLPTFTYRAGVVLELVEHVADSTATIALLLAKQLQPREKELDVLGSGLEATRSESEAFLSQSKVELVGGDAADAMLLEDSRELVFLESTSLVRGRRVEEQSPQPGFIGCGTQLEQLREESMQLSPELIGETARVFAESGIDTSELSESNHQRVVELEVSEVMPVGTKRIGTDKGVEAVVFGASHGVAVAEAVELLGVEGEDIEPMLEKGFDNGSMGQLESDGASRWLPELEETLHEFGDSDGRMLESELGEFFSFGIDKTGLMEIAAIVDAGEDNVTSGHGNCTSVIPVHASVPHRPCTGARSADSPRDVHLRLTRRDAGPPQALVVLGPHMAFPAGWPVVTS